MDLTKELAQYKSLVSYDRLMRAVEIPISVCPEEVSALIPSIEVGNKGPILGHLFLVTPHYLCDISLHPTIEEFDYISLNTITNYRFYLSNQIVKHPNNRKIRYQVARIELLHELNEFKTELNYAGNDRELWLRAVTAALPLSVIL